VKPDFNLLPIFSLFLCFSFARRENFLAHVTRWFDPKILFLSVIPATAAFNTKIYARLLLTILLTEYLNTILKWVLAEDRPFWWVNETKEFSKLNRPKLYQNELTCETSPGMPSGHLMTSAALLYTLTEILEVYLQKINQYLKIALRTIYYTTLFLISVSRMYFGCHFLHQCIVGYFMGALVARVTTSGKFEDFMAKLTKRKRILYLLFLWCEAFAVYWVQKAFGVDPQWSVKMVFFV
jgi:glucose-6-phosphatase